jgi:hypothetical protein
VPNLLNVPAHHGQEIRQKRTKAEEKTVHCVAYVPSAVDSQYSQTICIWWSAGGSLEFFSEVGESTTVFNIDKPSVHAVTSIGIDIDGNVWTGKIKGGLRVRRNQQWDFIAEEQLFDQAIKVIAFDDQQRAWVGDESGELKVVKFSEEGKFSPRQQGSSSLRQASRSNIFSRPTHFEGESHIEIIASLTVPKRGGNMSAQPSSSHLFGEEKSQKGQMESHGPIRCIFSDGPHAWVSGGKGQSGSWIALWSALELRSLDRWECGAFGPCNSMKPLGWQAGGSPSTIPPYMMGLVSASTMPLSDPSLQASVEVGRAKKTRRRSYIEGGPPPMDWRLLTGHESGQLVMWHPAATRLCPLLYFGDPCHNPICGIMVFESLDLICTGHANGEVQIFVRPHGFSAGVPSRGNMAPMGELVPGSSSAHPSSFACHK